MTAGPTETPSRRKPPRGGLFGGLRSSFLTGLVVVAPVGLTIYLIWTLAGWIDAWVLPVVPTQFHPDQYIGVNIRGIGVVIFLVFTVVVGWLAKGLIGRSLIRWGEHLVDRTPVVRSIYGALKQIAETVFSQTDTNFDKACLVQFPRPGMWAIAFISTEAKGEIRTRVSTDDTLLTVFMPTTPNPTSGFLMFVPKSEVIELDMTIEDAAKLIISAGLVYPNGKDAAAALEREAARTRDAA